MPKHLATFTGKELIELCQMTGATVTDFDAEEITDEEYSVFTDVKIVAEDQSIETYNYGVWCPGMCVDEMQPIGELMPIGKPQEGAQEGES